MGMVCDPPRRYDLAETAAGMAARRRRERPRGGLELDDATHDLGVLTGDDLDGHRCRSFAALRVGWDEFERVRPKESEGTWNQGSS